MYNYNNNVKLTWVRLQVRERYRLALHLIWDATQEDVDHNLLSDVLVLIGWSLKHDGDLPVNVRLGEFPIRLPRAFSEEDLYVVCGSATTQRTVLIPTMSRCISIPIFCCWLDFIKSWKQQ